MAWLAVLALALVYTTTRVTLSVLASRLQTAGRHEEAARYARLAFLLRVGSLGLVLLVLVVLVVVGVARG